MERRYKISGMTCAACAAGIQKTVSKMKGVRRAEVSLMGESMVAEFDESAIDSARIVAAVEALGYGAKEEGQEPELDAGRRTQEGTDRVSEASRLKRRFLLFR